MILKSSKQRSDIYREIFRSLAKFIMVPASLLIDELTRHCVTYFTGVPCSYLAPVLDEAVRNSRTHYIVASSEGEALAIASGVWLGGSFAAVLCQNSGLGNMVNPLTSLNDPFGIPALIFVTWRGRPGTKDEPQHSLMGEITPDLLTLLRLRWEHFPESPENAAAAIAGACSYVRAKRRSHAFLVSAGSIVADPRPPDRPAPRATPTRLDALKCIVHHATSDSILIATTGKTGRELLSIREHPSDLYCVGSMGYANALAHGIALTTKRRVYIVDGDGAALMHLGNFTSIGMSAPPNLIHILLDNGVYDSTGAQSTASAHISFPRIAAACGYSTAVTCNGMEELRARMEALSGTGPHLVHVPIAAGSVPAGRPTIPPNAIAKRLQQWIAGTPNLTAKSTMATGE